MTLLEVWAFLFVYLLCGNIVFGFILKKDDPGLYGYDICLVAIIMSAIWPFVLASKAGGMVADLLEEGSK